MCFFTELTTRKLLTVMKEQMVESKAHQSSPVKDQLKVWFKDCKKLSAIPMFMEVQFRHNSIHSIPLFSSIQRYLRIELSDSMFLVQITGDPGS